MKTKEWLKKNRKRVNLTQEELAEKLSLSTDAIRNIEQGKRLGSLETWKKIENFFEENYKISIDSEELIDELKEDIKEFGENEPCILIYKTFKNNIIFTNYDFVVEEKPFNPKKELLKGEKYIKTTLKYALEVFEEQNEII